MRFVRKKDGFTLMELIIVILTGSIVTMAATTVLLLAFRINRKSMDTISRQSVTRIMLSVLENISSDKEYVFLPNAEQASNGDVADVDGMTSWKINEVLDDGTIKTLIQYSLGEQAIVSGTNNVLVEKVQNSKLYKTYTPFDYVRELYTFSVKIQNETYDSTVYSRTQEKDWRADDPLVDYEAGRNALVNIAAAEVGSTGNILNGPRLGVPYYTWYNSAWTSWTPWCGCFVSWAIEECSLQGSKTDANGDTIPFLSSPVPREADVDLLWLRLFTQAGSMEDLHVYRTDPSYVPKPGDLIFFEDKYEENENVAGLSQIEDFSQYTTSKIALLEIEMSYETEGRYILKEYRPDGNPTPSRVMVTKSTYDGLEQSLKDQYEEYDVVKHYLQCIDDGLDHVGIVSEVKDSYVYTIEGNVPIGEENSRVVMRRYPLTNAGLNSITPSNMSDRMRIFGYATLNWNEAYK